MTKRRTWQERGRHRPTRTGLSALALFLGSASAACAARTEPQLDAPAVQLPPAPWAGPRIPSNAVAPVYLAEWREAENRATCAPVAFSSLGAEQASPRAATFSGGWAVAYDQPQLRSAFGIAGAGVLASEPSYDEWPHHRSWADGSTAGYGPEGGSGPNQLAYLRIAGQQCLYNVWSRLGVAHLEYLLDAIRFVERN